VGEGEKHQDHEIQPSLPIAMIEEQLIFKVKEDVAGSEAAESS